MNKKAIDKIRNEGLENYLATSFAKKIKRDNAALTWFFIIGGIFFVGGGVLTLFADDTTSGPFIAIAIGAVSFLVAWLCARKPAPKSDAYKEELNKRHGDYKAVLNEIEYKLLTEHVHNLDIGGFYSVSDWLIVLCSMQGVHFIRKVEIAAIIGTGDGTKIIWDNGESFNAYFNKGHYAWEEAFYILAADNPHLLSNGDMVANLAGVAVTLETVMHHEHKASDRLITQQYLNNKAAGIAANWAQDMPS